MSASKVAKHPRKARRITRACDYCHRRSIRCTPSSDGDGSKCQNCVDFAQSCTYDRPVRRRGAKVQPWLRSGSVSTIDGSQHVSSHVATIGFSPPNALTHPQERLAFGYQNETTSNRWRAPHVASQAVIMDLVEIYFEVIYPIFPFFHQPTFLRKVSRGEYHTDQFLFAAVMAVCALASARARDGSLFSARWNPAQLEETPSETFYEVARDTIRFSQIPDTDYNCMRAYALLCITNIQSGQMRLMHQNLARYHAIVAMEGLHDEANWPKDIGIVEIEERRRLFWSVYTLDVYASIIWSGIPRYREAHCDVQYPTEIDDEMFDDNGFSPPSCYSPPIIGPSPSRDMHSTRETSWLCGWNFTTDLYRVLEHAIDNFRSRRAGLRKQTFVSEIFGNASFVSPSSVCDNVMTMYANLPQRFKETPPITFDTKKDRFGFQSANIIATVQLLRMVLFTASGATVSQRCQIAREVVDSFVSIPLGYLNAISSPLLHHLAGIGAILGSVLEGSLCESEYLQVRSVLLSMAQLLANLDLTTRSTGVASERLRAHVARIDEYMATQRLSFGKDQQLLALHQPVNSHSASGPSYESATMPPQQVINAPTEFADSFPQFQLPAELLGEWPWVFDFGQPID